MKLVYAFAAWTMAVALTATGCKKKDAPDSDAVNARKETLHIFTWSDYFNEDAIKRFESEFNAQIILDTYENNEDLVAKLQAGVAGYDLVVPSDYAVAQLISLKLLEPLDKGNIPNFANLDSQFLNQYFDPGNVYSIPYLWGSSGIGYNSSVIKKEPTSWAVLWDKQYQGGVNMLDDMRETLGVALKRLGASINATDPKLLKEAQKLLIQQKPLLVGYTTETDALMLADQVVLTHAWSGDVLRVSAERPEWKFVFPTEGGTFFIDNIAVPKGAKNKALAEKFANFILQPDVIASVTAFTHYGNAIPASSAYLPENLKGNPAIFPPKEVLEKLETIHDLGEAEVLYGEVWTAVKSAQ